VEVVHIGRGILDRILERYGRKRVFERLKKRQDNMDREKIRNIIEDIKHDLGHLTDEEIEYALDEILDEI